MNVNGPKYSVRKVRSKQWSYAIRSFLFTRRPRLFYGKWRVYFHGYIVAAGRTFDEAITNGWQVANEWEEHP